MSTTTHRTIKEAEFYDVYKPVKNHLDSNASFDGCQFETYGKELEYVTEVNKKEPGRVWTVLDVDGTLIIDSGMSYVNRMGFLITEKAVADNEMLSVEDDADSVFADEDGED